MLLKMHTVYTEAATYKDILTMQQILKDTSLPFSDIVNYLPDFILVKQEDVILGLVGLEVYNDAALLRSLAVIEIGRNKGVGHYLYNAIEKFAKQKNIKTFYLLTETAEKFFQKNGFHKIERNRVPEKIAATDEFRTICPSTAIAMMKNI